MSNSRLQKFLRSGENNFGSSHGGDAAGEYEDSEFDSNAAPDPQFPSGENSVDDAGDIDIIVSKNECLGIDTVVRNGFFLFQFVCYCDENFVLFKARTKSEYLKLIKGRSACLCHIARPEKSRIDNLQIQTNIPFRRSRGDRTMASTRMRWKMMIAKVSLRRRRFFPLWLIPVGAAVRHELFEKAF